MKFTKRNLQNIKNRVAEQAGVEFHQQHPISVRKAVLVAVIAACSLLMMAFTVPLFSPLEGDELSLSASYMGDGILLVTVENHSDKVLEFQEKVQLYSWTTNEIIPQQSGNVSFDKTVFEARSVASMHIDLRGAYDIAALEARAPGKPEEAYYYLLLTNQDFFFGHDWICSFHFMEDTEKTTEEISVGAAQTIGSVVEELRFYFERAYYDEIPAFNAANFDYIQKVKEVLARTEGTLVRPVDPWITIQPPENGEFDSIGLNYHPVDGYKRIIGTMFSGGDNDYTLQIKAMLPDEHGNPERQYIPLLYLAVYEQAALEVEEPYAFLAGQIIPFDDMEPWQIYEDGRYVVYDVTDLFYTDLDAYLEDYLSFNQGISCGEADECRLRGMYDYYRKNIGGLITNRQEEAEAKAFQP